MLCESLSRSPVQSQGGSPRLRVSSLAWDVHRTFTTECDMYRPLGSQLDSWVPQVLHFSYHAVEMMRQGMNVTSACDSAIARIVDYYPNFSGAIVAVTKTGEHGRYLRLIFVREALFIGNVSVFICVHGDAKDPFSTFAFSSPCRQS